MSASFVPRSSWALRRASRVERFGLLGEVKKRLVSPCERSQPSRMVLRTPDCLRTT